MGVYYLVVNTAKKEYYNPGHLASASKWDGLLNGISGHALAVLIGNADGDVGGRWAGDPLFVVGDEHNQTILHWVEEGRPKGHSAAIEILANEYTDITPQLIAYLSQQDSDTAQKLARDAALRG
jgi:hypothetical protein